MGDTAHQQRRSDHNAGNAFDLTHDPVNKPDCNVWSQIVISDPRVTYVIWNSKIYVVSRGNGEITQDLILIINICMFRYMKLPETILLHGPGHQRANNKKVKRIRHFVKNPRYHFLFKTKDPITWTEGLQESGYATDPDYAKKLIFIMKKERLL